MLADLINHIVMILEDLVLAIGYPGIFLVMFIESIFPPFPSEPLYPFFGMLITQSHMTYFGVWLTIVLGSTIGALIPYAVGAWTDIYITRSLVQRHGARFGIKEHDLDRVLALFRRYGPLVVLFGRSIPMFKFLVSLTAGASQMRLPIFITCTALNSAASATLWVTVGYLLGENWPIILDLVDALEPLLIVLAVLAIKISLYLYIRRMGRRKQQQAISDPPPPNIQAEF